MSRDTEGNKWRTGLKGLGWVIGGAGLGIVIGTIPFVTPALRKYCLPYVPATPAQVSRLVNILRESSAQHVIDVGSGDGRVVSGRGHREGALPCILGDSVGEGGSSSSWG